MRLFLLSEQQTLSVFSDKLLLFNIYILSFSSNDKAEIVEPSKQANKWFHCIEEMAHCISFLQDVYVCFLNPAVFVLVALSGLKQKEEVHRVGDH